VTRTVLITGGAGFIGSNLTRRLVRRGDRVRILDDLSIGQTAYLDGVPNDLVRGSLADAETVRSAVAGVDAIVHLAARAGIDDSVRDPLGTFEANVTWSVGLLDAARLAGVRRFVFARRTPPPATIHHRATRRTSPSDLAVWRLEVGDRGVLPGVRGDVRAGRLLAALLQRLRAVLATQASVVAAWLRAALADRPIEINGDGRQTRDFVHADDLAAAVEAVWTHPEDDVAGELFQAGTGVETTVAALADEIGGRSGGRSTSVTDQHGRGHPAERGPGRKGRLGAWISGGDPAGRWAGRGQRPGSHRRSRTPLWPRSRPTRRRAPSDPGPMTASSEAPSAPPPAFSARSRVGAGSAARPASPLLRDAFITIVTASGWPS
jgi:UDP-glucose 4-epimerase